MGRRKKQNTNTRRRRLYEAKMRGKETQEMRAARLADPSTLTGLTMLSVAELDQDAREMESRRASKRRIAEQAADEIKKRALQRQVAEDSAKRALREQREREETMDAAYLKVCAPNYWTTKQETETVRAPVGWWAWIFG